MKLLFLSITCIIFLNCYAQTITLDLAENKNNSFSQTVEPQKLKQVVIKNKITVDVISGVAVKYQIDIKKEHEEVPAIPTGGFLAMAGGATCTNLNTALGKLESEIDEEKIPDEIIEVDKQVKLASAACQQSIDKAAKLKSLTSHVWTLIDPIDIIAGDKITIVVTRTDNNTKWTYVFSTERIAHSKIYYGFSYLFSNTLTSYPTYYSKQDTGSTYFITRSHNTNQGILKNISPTFMYSYLFFKNPDAPIKFGLTGGFMLDLSNPSAVFSPSLIIGDNLSLNLGIALTQKDQLKGQYEPNQRITENLDFDQLHSKVWTYDMFFSIAFHFDKNPFKKDSDKSSNDK